MTGTKPYVRTKIVCIFYYFIYIMIRQLSIFVKYYLRNHHLCLILIKNVANMPKVLKYLPKAIVSRHPISVFVTTHPVTQKNHTQNHCPLSASVKKKCINQMSSITSLLSGPLHPADHDQLCANNFVITVHWRGPLSNALRRQRTKVLLNDAPTNDEWDISISDTPIKSLKARFTTVSQLNFKKNVHFVRSIEKDAAIRYSALSSDRVLCQIIVPSNPRCYRCLQCQYAIDNHRSLAVHLGRWCSGGKSENKRGDKQKGKGSRHRKSKGDKTK